MVYFISMNSIKNGRVLMLTLCVRTQDANRLCTCIQPGLPRFHNIAAKSYVDVLGFYEGKNN